jgi:hypothetical protein
VAHLASKASLRLFKNAPGIFVEPAFNIAGSRRPCLKTTAYILVWKITNNKMAERTGLEPATSGVTGQHSNQLNYRSAAQ